ncbi:MAG: hypothetical protein JXA96_04985 [Sedimentisphaerales bacterium]|nr:hypothetical protein [Sedimentisphaerales bacterium]
MGRCKGLSIIVCLILVLNCSAQTITLEESVTQTFILNPVDASNPTHNDNGDRISGILRNEAWFAFDLSSLPSNLTIVSATFSAYFWNGSTVPSWREMWYYSDDSWITITGDLYANNSDPGDDIIADEMVGKFWHSELPDEGYVWKTIPITYNNWANDIADNYISFMFTGGQYYGAVGQGPTTFDENWGVDKMPELTLTIISNPQPITVTSPNGGESFQAGTPQTITWNSTGEAGENVKIELYKNNSYLSDIAVSTANDGEYTWLVPSVLPADTTYKVKIIDTSNSSTYDFSNNYFSITDLFPSSGSLQFTSSVYSAFEIIGTVRIYVSRTGGSLGVASVNYSTSNGTAIAGSDFTQKSGTLFWNDGDMQNKYFDVSITNDNTYETDETFTVSLKDAIGANLESPNQATVIITDNDQPSSGINPPEVDTLSSINITSDTAELMGFLKNDGSDETDENCTCRFTYWKVGEQENALSTNWQNGVNQGQYFSAEISNLDPNTIYSFYAKAINSAGITDGNTLKFKTLPDPNLPPVSFDPNEPNTLLIQNFVKVLMVDPNKPHNNQGLLTYVEKAGNLNGIDYNDVFYSVPASLKESKIASLVPMPEKQGNFTGFYELSKDTRSNYALDSLLELSIYSLKPNDPNIYSENFLKFWFADNAFDGKTVTIQKVSYDPNIIYPVWDVNEIISNNGRKMILDDLTDQELNTPYALFTLSTSRKILDLNEDGFVDLADFAFLITDVGKTGIYRSDIACIKNTVQVFGIPDGQVDDTDIIVFINEYNEKHPDNPITDPYAVLLEDFENGKFQEGFTTFGDSLWTISNDAYLGILSAKSGTIGDNQFSVLEANITASTGNISFWRKVSSEANYDYLSFYIDNIKAGSWSGNLDWQEVNFQTSPGDHNLKWVYLKDNCFSSGQDAAWIDNIKIK